MKKYLLFAFIALFCVSSHSAWAHYVKHTTEDRTVSWIKLVGTINGTKSQYQNTPDWNSTTNVKDATYDFSAQNADGVTIYYNIVSETDKTCEVTYKTDKSGLYGPNEVFTDYAGVVNIPSSANGYRVIGIGDYAFAYCGNMTSLTIPNTVTYFGEYAFYGLCGFTSLTIPSSVTSIGLAAFENNWDLTSITIPNSVTSIGRSAFSNCIGLTSITSEIRNVFKTGENAFELCDNATLYVPHGTISQYQNTADWNRIANIIEVFDFSAQNADGVTIYYNIVSETDKTCEVTYKTDKSGLYGPNEVFTDYAGVVNIPSSANGYRVIGIGDYAFAYCGNMTSLTIPNTVTYFGEYAFYGLCGFTSLTIPSSVTSIGLAAFENNWDLTSITIPNSVTSIGRSAFSNCIGLTSIISEIRNVFKTGENAFGLCDNATLYVPKGLADTYRSTADWNEITIIKEVPYDFSAQNADGVTIYYKIVSETDKTCEVSYMTDKIGYDPTEVFIDYAGVVNIPSSANGYSVIGIGDYAFALCGNLTSLTIPNTVTYIGEDAFYGLCGLTSLTIPQSVTRIEDWAFENNWDLTSITIPSSVTSIGNYAFSGCFNLTSITSEIRNVFETGYYAFEQCDNATLYVPGGTKNQYQNTADWNRFSKIEEIFNYVPLSLSCNNKGKVIINGGAQFTNDMDDVSVFDEKENTFIFQPNDNCELIQVLINGSDVTLSIENNQLTRMVNSGSKMIVLFDNKSYDVNDDGKVDISDVVKLVNAILGQ